LTARQMFTVALWVSMIGLLVAMIFMLPWPVPALLLAGALGVALLGRRPFADAINGAWLRRDPMLKTGHYIRIEGQHDVEGYVIAVGFRYTQLQTPAGDVARIPNTTLANSVFTDFFLAGKDAILIDIEAAATEPERVVRLLDQEADKSADAIPGIVAGSQQIRTLPGRFPECRRYVMHCQPRNPTDRMEVRDELQRRVIHRLGREGIRVPTLTAPPTKDEP
jgi:small-conductance mechanosensitive channel